MNKKCKILSLFLVVLFATSLFMSGTSVSAVEGGMYFPDHWEIKSDKIDYNFGEEITIEVLFSPNDEKILSENYTYYIKLAESPCYEIIGENVVCAESSDGDEMFKGTWDYFHYRFIFKIKINEQAFEESHLTFYVNCVENDWLKKYYNYEKDPQYSEDPEYDMKIITEYDIEVDSDGIHFPLELFSQETITVKLPKEYYFFNTLYQIFRAIKSFFEGLFSWLF